MVRSNEIKNDVESYSRDFWVGWTESDSGDGDIGVNVERTEFKTPVSNINDETYISHGRKMRQCEPTDLGLRTFKLRGR